MSNQVLVLLNMEIIEENHNDYIIHVKKREETSVTVIEFNTENHRLVIEETTDVGRFLKENEHQFRKILHNKRPRTFYPGFILDFSIIREKDIKAFNDKSNIIVSEGRQVYVIAESAESIPEMYTDGSYLEEKKVGAWGYALTINGEIVEECAERGDSHSSSHLELMAVINGLSNCLEERLRIYTDSQYVRKGITEWIFHWRENGFMTANGTKAKNASDWIQLDELIQGRYIEWCWIKGHRANVIHNHVDEMVGKKTWE